MEKPEDIPQWAWDRALRVEGGQHPGIIEACARAILKAREEAFEECAKLIEEGFDRDVAEPYRDDGKPSKNDECSHGRFVYEDCEQCAVLAIRLHSQKGER